MKIQVVMCPADRAPYVTNIENSLENMQRIVGGYIETVTISDVVIVCNEEGKLKNLPENDSMFTGGFNGDCFVCGFNGDAFDDIPEERKKLVLSRCRERWRCKSGT